MASFYFHQKWCVIFWKFFLGCGRHQLLREGCVLPANACALSSWLENALKMKKVRRTGQSRNPHFVGAPPEHNGLRCLYLVILHGEMLLRA